MVIEEREIPAAGNRQIATPYGPLGDGAATVLDAAANARSAYTANPPAGWAPAQAPAAWQAAAQTAAKAYCVTQGYNRAVRVSSVSSSENWGVSSDEGGPGNIRFRSLKSRRWTATCQKTKRRRR